MPQGNACANKRRKQKKKENYSTVSENEIILELILSTLLLKRRLGLRWCRLLRPQLTLNSGVNTKYGK